MKKLLLFFALIMSICATAQAGYIIRSIPSYVEPSSLVNYTLTFDENGEPIAAATTSYIAFGQQSIAVVRANTTNARVFHIGSFHKYIGCVYRSLM